MNIRSGVAIILVFSFFRWFRGAKANAVGRRQPTASTEVFPQTVEVIAGKLKVRIFLHEIKHEQEMIPCWSYVTDGLMAHKQKEIIFTLRRASGQKPEDYPRQVLDLFAIIFPYAERGELVDVGDSTIFGKTGFSGNRDFRGIGYIEPENIPGIETRDVPLLAAILLKHDEAKIAWDYGLTRVTALLGLKYRHYPCPTWSDLERQPVVSLRGMDESFLGKVSRVGVRASYYEEQNRISLSILPSSRARLQELLGELPPTQPVALRTEPDPRADACLVWHPGQDKPMAITSPDSNASRKTGAFLAFVPEQDANEIRMVEDGFGLLLTNNSWQKIREALLSGTEVFVPLSEAPEASISVEWAKTTYTSPVTGETIRAERWTDYVVDTAYQPDTTSSPKERVAVSSITIVLLTREQEAQKCMTVDDAACYLNAIENAVDTFFSPREPRTSRELTIQLALAAAGHEVRMISVPALSTDVAEDLLERLESVPAPKVRGPVKFEVILSIWSPTSKQ